MEYFGKILGKIGKVDGIYTGNLGVKFNKLDNGLFECLNEKSITAYQDSAFKYAACICI